MQTRDSGHAQRPARKLLGGALALLMLAIALIWLLWGFRWPPTAEVVIDEPEAERYEP